MLTTTLLAAVAGATATLLCTLTLRRYFEESPVTEAAAPAPAREASPAPPRSLSSADDAPEEDTMDPRAVALACPADPDEVTLPLDEDDLDDDKTVLYSEASWQERMRELR